MKGHLPSIARASAPGGSGSYRHPSGPAGHGTAQFEYVGRSAVTAIGPVTGRRYNFTTPGARVAVDLRDRGGLAFVPSLRLLR